MSLPATHAGLLSPAFGRPGSRTPTPQDSHSNVGSPTPGSSSSVTSHAYGRATSSPTSGRSRSRQRKLTEIGEEEPHQQHGRSSGDSEQRRSSDQPPGPRAQEGVKHQHRQRSHSPHVSGREESRGGGGERNGQKNKPSKRSLRKKAQDDRSSAGTNNEPESGKSIPKSNARADIFERGYDNEQVDSRPISPRPPKARRSPLLLRRKSRDDLMAPAVDKKDSKDLHFGPKQKRDLSLDRVRSPKGSLKRKNNVPVEVTPPTPVREAPPIGAGDSNKTIEADPVSTSTISSFDDNISTLTAKSPPQLIMKELQDPE